jgi:hypothetical protein
VKIAVMLQDNEKIKKRPPRDPERPGGQRRGRCLAAYIKKYPIIEKMSVIKITFFNKN